MVVKFKPLIWLVLQALLVQLMETELDFLYLLLGFLKHLMEYLIIIRTIELVRTLLEQQIKEKAGTMPG